MDIEERLNRVADGYRAQGYRVVVRPGPDVLPPFASDFRVEILAARADGSVLATAKASRAELEADAELARYAEVIEAQPGWRYDIFVLEPGPQARPEEPDARELSEQEIAGSLEDAERLLRAGFIRQAFIAAWAILEAAMRGRLAAEGRTAGWGSSPRAMLNELYSEGVLTTSTFRDLEGLFRARNAIVHGFQAPAIEAGAVRFLIETARKLREESRAVRQTA